ncbi:unnamed protein product, partial [marine sediment metagenome]
GNFRFAVGLYNKETTNQDWFQTSDFVFIKHKHFTEIQNRT